MNCAFHSGCTLLCCCLIWHTRENEYFHRRLQLDGEACYLSFLIRHKRHLCFVFKTFEVKLEDVVVDVGQG